MMEELEVLLQQREIDFNAKDRQIMCFLHTMNICVKHVLDKIFDADLDIMEQAFIRAFPDESVNKDLYLAAVKDCPISLGRDTVHTIHASGLRRDEFMDVVKDGNRRGWFKSNGQVVQVPENELLQDVRTRWDSVFYMINCLRAMHLVSYWHGFLM
jgi:hypothetical protein